MTKSVPRDARAQQRRVAREGFDRQDAVAGCRHRQRHRAEVRACVDDRVARRRQRAHQPDFGLMKDGAVTGKERVDQDVPAFRAIDEDAVRRDVGHLHLNRRPVRGQRPTSRRVRRRGEPGVFGGDAGNLGKQS